ncbi:MAG: hypothetical protein JWR54_3278 [Mucilaginibacter sp.]|nr:hypothetical protein [Mucilaginibacter sp.]
MKKTLTLFSCVLILLSACSKKSTPALNPLASVTISGKAYGTIIIGSQTWTTQNYDGPGGVANAQESSVGKFYLSSELSSIELPTGWRIPIEYSEQCTPVIPLDTTPIISGIILQSITIVSERCDVALPIPFIPFPFFLDRTKPGSSL